jgi:hypothetical protein
MLAQFVAYRMQQMRWLKCQDYYDFFTVGEMKIIPGDPTDGASGTVPVCNRGDEWDSTCV